MSESHEYPLVTFALFAYNQERYIREAVEAALAQDYPNLEIIISDDCSTDGTYEIMSEVIGNYSGSHVVKLLRNKENFGISRHFNSVMRNAAGEIIAVAAGDDISMPDRVSNAVRVLVRDHELMFVSFVDRVIGDYGDVIHEPKNYGWTAKVVTLHDFFRGGVPLSGASRVFRRDAYDYFGLINDDCPTEDRVMLLRSLLLGNGVVLGRPGISYRRHENNLSGPRRIHKMNLLGIRNQHLDDLRKAVERKPNLDPAIVSLVWRWTERDFNRRRLAAEIYSEGPKLFLAILSLLFSSNYSLREKFSLLIRRALLGVVL